MKVHVLLALAILSVLDIAACSPDCGEEENSPEALRLNVFSKKNRVGKWITEFRAYKDDSEINQDGDFGVEVTQDLVVCDGRRKVVIHGKITGLSEIEVEANRTSKHGTHNRIRFHSRTGINAILFDGGRTVEKPTLSETGYGLAFTNRPLKNDELFEVILEKKTSNFKNSLSIGVSSVSPENMIIPKHISNAPPPCWSLYYNDVYHNKVVVRQGYGRSLDTLVVGDRVGVMRRSSGELHFYINGVDQGAAVSNVPSPVYGVVELYANAARATIVDRP